MVRNKIRGLFTEKDNSPSQQFCPYYRKEIFVQEKKKKFFYDNSILRLHPQSRLPECRSPSCLVYTAHAYHQMMNLSRHHLVIRRDYTRNLNY